MVVLFKCLLNPEAALVPFYKNTNLCHYLYGGAAVLQPRTHSIKSVWAGACWATGRFGTGC